MSSTGGAIADFSGTSAAEAPMRLGSIGGLIGGIAPGFDRARAGIGLTDTKSRYDRALYGEMIGAVQRARVAPPTRRVELLGTTLLEMPGQLTNPAYEPEDVFGRRQAAEARLFGLYRQARARNPQLPDIGDADRFRAEVARRRHADVAAADDRIEGSFAGEAGAFVGAIGAGFTDPTVLLSLGLGAGAVAARTTAGTIALRAGAEAGLQGTVAAATAPWLMEDASEHGFQYDLKDAAVDVAAGAALGGLFGAASGVAEIPAVREGARRLARPVATSARGLAEKLRGLGRPLTGEETDALRVLEHDASIEETSPYAARADDGDDVLHRAQLEEATDALVSDRPSGLPAVPPPSIAINPDQPLPGHFAVISAKDLHTDPATFQYKAGGDAYGVTGKLARVTAWNDDAANSIIVWERGDGTKFVADGHQRTGLAKRLIDEGKYDDIPMLARVYREADGVSAEVAMLRAASANIMSGTGTPLDAARIIRRVGLNSDYLRGFDRATAFGQQSIGLSRLSDDAFGMVINGDDTMIPIGALVGRVAPDNPELHAQAITMLRTADVTSDVQRELLLRDLLAAPRVQEVQTDMFGMLQVTRGLYAERARVLDRAMELIRREKRALLSAADNAETLEQVGAKVDRALAERIAGQNAETAMLIERLARVTDNPVNDALSGAATAMHEGKSIDAAARAFLGDLRSRPDIVDELVRGGGAGGDGAGGSGLAGDAGGGAAAESGARAGDAAGAAAGTDAGGLTRQTIVDGQRGRSLDDLLAMAAENQPRLNADVEAIAREMGVKPVTASPKSRERVIEKFEQDAGYSEYGELVDLARASFVITDPAQADRIVEALRRRFGVFDKGWAEQRTGYVDRKLLVRMENGGAAEIQIIPEKVYAFKEEGGHDAYKISRDASRPEAEREEARAFEREGYAAARAGSPFEDFGSLSKSASGNSARNLSSDMVEPSVSSLMVKADANAPGLMGADFHSPRDQANPTPSTSAQGRQSYSRSSTDIDDPFGTNIGLDKDESNAAADAIAGRAIDDFDDPFGAGAEAQADHLMHDMRMDAEPTGEPGEPGAVDEGEQAGLFDLFDPDEPTARAEIDAIDDATSAFDAVKGCLGDPGAAA